MIKINLNSESILERNILGVMEEVKTIGITVKQIADKIGEDEERVNSLLTALREKGRISRIGRSLWILTMYKDMNKDPNFVNPEHYIKEFKNKFRSEIAKYKQKITFSENGARRIHRWSPYVQGFSASFVDNMLTRHGIKEGQCVLDPFVGSGTVSVCAKTRGINSVGIDLMPLMTFMAKVKTTWDLDVNRIRQELNRVSRCWKKADTRMSIPFLKNTERQFNPEVLKGLLILKESILTVEDDKIRNLFKLAFASILVNSSNLKRSPCLGYVKNKKVSKEEPFVLFREKVKQMHEDLSLVNKHVKTNAFTEFVTGDARMITFKPETFDIAITSPPYVNGLDYVINYKIEMAWLELVKGYKDLQMLKEQMVACDNVPKGVIRNFSQQKWKYSDEWLEDIIDRIALRIQHKSSYRRSDMHLIVRKYFEDLYPVFKNVYDRLDDGGRFILVIGDSLIAGVYIPADLILAKMGKEVGFDIERVEIARERRSGQRRDFRLRESIITLVKGMHGRAIKKLNYFFKSRQ